MGFVIFKKFVEMYGGIVGVISRVGEGSEFFFIIFKYVV